MPSLDSGAMSPRWLLPVLAGCLLAPGPARAQEADGFSAKAPRGSFGDLSAGRLTMPVHCPQDCTVAANLIVAAADQRRMGFPGWRSQLPVATESDQDSFSAGDSKLTLATFPTLVGRLKDALAFPLFGRVRIKVELQADWGEGSVITSVTGSLRWPLVGDDNGGRRGTVRGIDVDEPVSLGDRRARFTVRLAPGSSAFAAGTRVAGSTANSQTFTVLDGARPATKAALARGGTFRVIVRWGAGAVQRASGLTPLAAEAWVQRGTSRAVRRFTLRG